MSAGAQKLKSRIKSAKNIAQITKAMEMVSAAKMRKAQERAVQSKPYANALTEMLQMIGARSGHDRLSHPLMQSRKNPQKALVVVFSSDKGLAGAFHANLFRQLSKFERTILDRDIPVHYVAYGKKGRDFLRYTKRSIDAVFETTGDKPTTKSLRPLVTYITEEFTSGRVDEVHLVFSEFVSTLVQKASHQKLLPFALNSSDSVVVNKESQMVPLFEPDQTTLLQTLLPFAIEYMVYKTVLQNLASEHSARMIAMKNAHDNAKEIGADLLLMFNQIRQATITQQIAEISSASMTSAA